MPGTERRQTPGSLSPRGSKENSDERRGRSGGPPPRPPPRSAPAPPRRPGAPERPPHPPLRLGDLAERAEQHRLLTAAARQRQRGRVAGSEERVLDRLHVDVRQAKLLQRDLDDPLEVEEVERPAGAPLRSAPVATGRDRQDPSLLG